MWSLVICPLFQFVYSSIWKINSSAIGLSWLFDAALWMTGMSSLSRSFMYDDGSLSPFDPISYPTWNQIRNISLTKCIHHRMLRPSWRNFLFQVTLPTLKNILKMTDPRFSSPPSSFIFSKKEKETLQFQWNHDRYSLPNVCVRAIFFNSASICHLHTDTL
jgi:hypothetical protein